MPLSHIDKRTCKIIDGILVTFLCKNKSHYLKKKSVILNSQKKGGLNLIDFSLLKNTIKKNCLNRFLKNPNFWNIFPQLAFSQLGGAKFALMCNYNVYKLPQAI